MRLVFTISLITLLLCNAAFSQDRTITGRLLDADTQKPVKNATIILLGTTDGTVSNHLGFFQLVVDPSKYKTLVVSHVGFKTVDVTIPDADNFRFFLKKEYVALNTIDLSFYPQEPPPQLQPLKPVMDTVSAIAEAGANFPGGIDNFYTLLGNALAKKMTLAAAVVFNITFTVNEKGQATNIVVSDSTVQETIDTIFQTMPPWTPAVQQRSNVAQHFKIQIVNQQLTALINEARADVTAFGLFMGKNLRYPAKALRSEVTGVVFMQFQVAPNGKVHSIQLVKDIGAGCGDEVRRVLSGVPAQLGKWLLDQAKTDLFVLPVAFSGKEPFKGNVTSPATSAFLLDIVKIRVVGIERERVSTGAPFRGNLPPIPSSSTQKINIKGVTASNSNRFSRVDHALDSFPSDLLKLKRTSFVDLEKNNIKTIPPDIQYLTKLEEFYLFENKIESLPNTFGSLHKLKVLGLGSNQLKSFPEQITQLENLEVLDLGGNQLTSLSSNIGNLKKLQILVLHDNNITQIPKAFYSLKHLRKLYLQGNPVDQKDKELLKATFPNAEIVF